jgi:dienelactone hydrolase
VPVVILLHHLGAADHSVMESYARYLSPRGIASVVMTLPYHMERRSRGDGPLRHFVGEDADVAVQAFDQSARDVSTIIDWLLTRSEIDAARIGVAGVSLGAIVTHLAMGRDARISAGVAAMGGGDLPDINRSSPIVRFFLRGHRRDLSADEIEKLRSVDPLSFANRNLPRRVLMIQGARDAFIPPHDAQKLWEALGRPPIQWLSINHLGIALAMGSTMRAATAYLESVWNGTPGQNVPRVHATTLKAGFISGLDSLATPAVQWEWLQIGRRGDHLPLLSGNLGMSGRGPFLGVAATVNTFVDVGVARRLGGDKIRPYASFHLTF